MSTPIHEIHTLDNGIRIVVDPMPGAQSLVLVFRFTFGAKDDPDDRLGITRIAEDVLFKGTPNRDAHDIFDAFDGLGIRRSSSTAVEHTSFLAQILPDKFRPTLELYAELFRSASFPHDQVEISKAVTLEELKRIEDNPIQQALYLTYQAGLGSPMGRIPLGEPDTISVISAAGVRRHWDTHCRPENLLIAVAGGLPSNEVINTLNNVFGDWAGESSEPEEPHSISVVDCSLHHEKSSEQTHICMLSASVPRGHDLYYAAQLTIAILSGGGSSRLFTEVREKRGLAYSVAAFYQARRGGGLVAVYAGTTADRAQETLDVCQTEIARLAKDVAKEELTRAKTVLKGRLFTTGDLPEGRAGGLIEDLFLQSRVRTIDEIAAGIDAVTLKQIPQYLESFLASPITLLVLGPQPLTKR
jgi:predicted Zn-dependent peptidase